MSRKFRCWRYLLTPSTHSFVTDELLYKNNSKFLYIVIPGFFRALRVFLVAFVTISAISKTVYHKLFHLFFREFIVDRSPYTKRVIIFQFIRQ